MCRPLPLVIAPAGALQSQLQRPEFLLQSSGLRGRLRELNGRTQDLDQDSND
jgi:hypothetical protein